MGTSLSHVEKQLRIPVNKVQAQKFYEEITKFVHTFEKKQNSQERLDCWTDELKHYVDISKDMKQYFISVLTLHTCLDTEKDLKCVKGLTEHFKSHTSVQDGSLISSNKQGHHPQKAPAETKSSNEEVPYGALQAEIETLHKELSFRKKQVEDKDRETEKLKRDIATVTQRLSEEWNAKVAADERNLENINIQNRPQNVAVEYELLCSNAWLDAKSSLDSLFTEAADHDKLKLLSDLLIIGADVASKKHSDMTKTIYAMISLHAEKGARSNTGHLMGIVSPKNCKAVHKPEKRTNEEEMQQVCESMPLNVKNAIGDFLRTTSDNTDISAISEEITIHLQKMLRNIGTEKKVEESEKELSYKGLLQYVEVCAKIGWKMAPQRPPMHLDAKTGIGMPFKGKEDQELYYSSENPKDPGNIVKYYVIPTLMHGETVMVHGKVYVGK